MQVPVVTTPVGAMGLEAEVGKELLVADTSADFAEQVNQLLDNQRLRASLAQTARSRVEASYSWEAIGDRLKEVYTQAVHASKHRAERNNN